MCCNVLNRITGLFKNVLRSMFLLKKIPDEQEYTLERTFNKLDIFMICIGVVSTSFYQEMPHVVNIFGYMIFFPLLVGGMMSYISSMCYAEMISIDANCGGGYSYLYYTMGEFMAFMGGWSVIAISAIRFIYCMVSITRVIDTSVFNNAMSNFTQEYFPIGGMENYFIHLNPNAKLENIFIITAITVLHCVALRYTKNFVNLVATLNIICIIICISIFWFYMDLSQFNIIRGTKDFSFFTKGAVLGNMFYMDFEVSLYSGQEAKNPKVIIPDGLLNGFKWGFIIYLASVILYSMRERKANMADFTPMQTALSKLGIEPFHLTPTIGLCLCLFMSAAARIFIISRIAYTMANDGMMFPFCKKIISRTQNPLITIFLTGFICGFVAIFIGDAPSTRLTMVGLANTMRILLLLCFLILRYRCERSNDYIDPADRWVLVNYPNPVLSPTKTTQTISILLIFLSVLTMTFSQLILVVYMTELDYKYISLRVAFIFSALITLAIILLLNQQPQNDRRKLSYSVRGVPFTPILAISWYILILIFLPHATWVKFACWWLFGIIFYFSYACMRSKAFIDSKKEMEKTDSVRGNNETI